MNLLVFGKCYLLFPLFFLFLLILTKMIFFCAFLGFLIYTYSINLFKCSVFSRFIKACNYSLFLLPFHIHSYAEVIRQLNCTKFPSNFLVNYCIKIKTEREFLNAYLLERMKSLKFIF